jgi:hypothetical protein
MPHKTNVAPLCRWCGMPIPKITETVYFASGNTPPIRNIDAKPKSRREAQRLVNQQIISLRWSYRCDEESYPRRKLGRDHIDMVTV